MRFKRPQVRYADTPQPATPYQAAAQAWDERIGSARVQAKNWRFMAFGCLALALLMAGGLVWRSAQSIVTPYVVEVDKTGEVRAVGEAATPYRPADAQIAFHLAQFFAGCRGFALLVPHRRVMAAQRQQVGMAAAFDDLAVIQHQDFVGIDHGGKPVRDHQRGAA